ncbi:hypothetical protein EI546_15970 [Aequorivita sp. H23M31]|uniref:Uncharacterized protein n=1 Tax=Aequorivita ciconiae TaxID=2494375 RepID=A0A410G759_9FLAO|nr:hypothetical protein [Aequorivita sp. H23M31]QAA83113.1 hypothetical protein EI546_15970 [Aequorivita sp. H23M31]
MTQESALGIIVGIIFIVLGLTLLTRYKTLTSHNYFRVLIFFVALLLLGFGIYMGIAGFYWNE